MATRKKSTKVEDKLSNLGHNASEILQSIENSKIVKEIERLLEKLGKNISAESKKLTKVTKKKIKGATNKKKPIATNASKSKSVKKTVKSKKSK